MGAVGLKQRSDEGLVGSSCLIRLSSIQKHKPEDVKDIREVLYDMHKALKMTWKNASETCRNSSVQ